MKEKELKIDDSQTYSDFLSESERKAFEQSVKPIKGQSIDN